MRYCISIPYLPIDNPARKEMTDWCNSTFGKMWGDTRLGYEYDSHGPLFEQRAIEILEFMFWYKEHQTMFELTWLL